MSRWTVVEKHESGGSVAMKFMTAGISGDMGLTDYCYTIEDEHGHRKKVIASDSYELGGAIAEGRFYETGTSEDSLKHAETSTSIETSGGGGDGSSFLGIVAGVVGFIFVMAFVLPGVGRALEPIFGFGIMAAIGWMIFRAVKKFTA